MKSEENHEDKPSEPKPALAERPRRGRIGKALSALNVLAFALLLLALVAGLFKHH